VESLWYDLRHALRQLRQRPLLAAVAIASLAIGIGANTAILSVANALFLKPPSGVADPARAVELGRTQGGRGRDTFSYPELLALREAGDSAFTGLAGWQPASLSYSTSGDGERVNAMAVSWNYFDVMGVRPAAGRFFTADEDEVPMTHPVAVVSERFWRGRLAAAPDIVGREIVLNRHTFTVVGVAPASFRGHIIGLDPDVYVPMMMMGVVRPGFSAFEEMRASWLLIVGRMRDGVTLAGANSVVHTAMARLHPDDADPRNRRSAVVDPLGLVPAMGRGQAGAFVGLLLAFVGIVLLVTCANVAGMLVARAATRAREIAIRLALGSGRRRLVRQLLAEALLLFAAGGTAGLLLAVWITGLATRIPLPTPVPVSIDLAPDARVLAAGFALALLTGVIFGLAPALQASRPDLAEAMKTGGAAPAHGGRLRRAFVMGQVGLSLLLLLASGLFVRSLQRAAAIPTGFDGHAVSVVSVDLSKDGYDEAHGQAFLADVLARLRSAPGITAAGTATDLPLDLSLSETPAYEPGSPAAGPEGWVSSAYTVVSDGYLDALHIGLLQGRMFDTRDAAGGSPVVVISRTFAERVWPGQDPIGRPVRIGDQNATPRTVIGVVADIKNQMLMESTEPAMFVPAAQVYTPETNIIARGATGTDAAATLRRVLHEADPRLSTSAIQSLDDITSVGTLPQRLAAIITSALGLLALVLSAMGVYGVVAFLVAQRTREIGVRRALGAQDRDVARLVLRGGLALAVPGIVVGVVAGLALSRLLRSFILGVAPGDPATFLGGPALLLIAVLLACWAPVRRALATEPNEALRAE